MEIGNRLKLFRQQCGLTQEELADRCELTKGYISQLENELTSPSISTLFDILDALGTTPQEFFSIDEEEKTVFTENDYFEKENDGYSVKWLVPNAQKNEMEPIMVTISPHSSTLADVPHEGEEFGYVLQGSVVLHNGKTSHTVKERETFYIVSDKPHYLENKTNKEVKVLWVASPPTF